MKFLYYDLIFLVVFTLFVVIFLYRKRKNLKREGIMYLYRTKVGMKIIDYIGGKYKRTLKVLSYVSIGSGYILMVGMIYLLVQIVYIYFKNPEIVRAIKIPPLIPLIPYLPSLFKIDFLPPFYFTYWIIAIAIIAVFHEFSHGVLMKRYNIGIKSTGFGFLGPFLAAFVEQDEKQMQKASKFNQIAVLSAGTFMNLVLAILFFLALSGFFALTYVPAGAIFNTYTPGVVNINEITMIDGINISALSNEGILAIIYENNITNDLILGGNGNSINLTKVIVNDKQYYVTIDNLKEQLESETEQVVLYEDLPAINAGLRGAIISIDGKEVKTHSELTEVMKDYKPNEKIIIKTKHEDEILEYNLILGEDPNQEGRAVIGIGVVNQRTRLIGKISDFFNFVKEPATNYEPRFSNSNFIIFIYNLIWWIALVNLSVALVNMLPVGIFDGGRMFMLTMWGLTGSEKFGKFMFKLATYFILLILFLLMFGWAIAVF